MTSDISSGLTAQIATYISQANADDYSAELYEHATLAFMDWICVSVVATDDPATQSVLKQASTYGGHAQASVIGLEDKVSISQAALINGTMSHAYDYDDTLTLFMGHPTATILPAAVAIAEWKGLSTKQLLAGYLLGLEVGSWLAQVIGPQHYLSGFHGTATIGRHAATATVSFLLGLTREQIIHALGIAGTQTAGLRRSFGTMAKPMHAGMAAEGGVNAAVLAQAGFEAAKDIYEGQFGVIQAMQGMANAFDPESFKARHPIEIITPKIHAACHCTHAPIEMMQTLAAERKLAAGDIESIDVRCSQVSLDNANKTNPQTGLEAKFSINYSMANALIHEDTGLAAYTDQQVGDSNVRALMERISVCVDDEHRNADLKTTCHFKLKDGEVVSRTLDPVETAPSLEEKRVSIAQKFGNLCKMVYSEQKTNALQQRLQGLVDEESVVEILEMTQKSN